MSALLDCLRRGLSVTCSTSRMPILIQLKDTSAAAYTLSSTYYWHIVFLGGLHFQMKTYLFASDLAQHRSFWNWASHFWLGIWILQGWGFDSYFFVWFGHPGFQLLGAWVESTSHAPANTSGVPACGSCRTALCTGSLLGGRCTASRISGIWPSKSTDPYWFYFLGWRLRRVLRIAAGAWMRIEKDGAADILMADLIIY